MKKLLGILVLGLLWCNVGFTEILDLGKSVKIKIFDNHEYFEVPFEDYSKMTWKDVGVTTLNINQMIKDREGLGFVGAEKSMIIGNKGIRILGDAELKRLKGEDTSNTELARIVGKCAKKTKSQKTFVKCYYKSINGDPMFQVTVADKKTDEFKFLTESLSQSLSKKEKDEIKKEFLQKNKTTLNSGIVQSKGNLKLIIFDDNRWLIYVHGTQKYPGLKIKIYSLILTINNHVVLINSWCFSGKTCKIIKKQMADIIEPSFPITKNYLKKIK